MGTARDRRPGTRPWTATARRSLPARAETTGLLLALGGVSAAVSAAAGYLLGESGGYGGTTFLWHQRLGIVVAIGAALTWAGWIAARRSASRAV